MQITARLEEETVRTLLGELLPLTIVLDDEGNKDKEDKEDKDGKESTDGADRWIRIDPARSIGFVANEGLRVEVGGQLHWKAAGLPVLLTIQSAQLLIRPLVVDDADGARLVFRPSLEKMDLKSVPGFLDSGIASIVNGRLEAEGDKLTWHFSRDLANRFQLPKEMLEVDSFTLAAPDATVDVVSDAVVLTLSLVAGFSRRTG